MTTDIHRFGLSANYHCTFNIVCEMVRNYKHHGGLRLKLCLTVRRELVRLRIIRELTRGQ